MKAKNHASLSNDFLSKGIYYSFYFFRTPPPSKPWFSRLALPRKQIVALGKLRLNYYKFKL